MPSTQLTPEQWREAKPPMSWRELKFASWTPTHFDIAEKWILENCEGWVYFKREDKIFVFETEGSATLFELWLEEDVVSREKGSI